MSIHRWIRPLRIIAFVFLLCFIQCSFRPCREACAGAGSMKNLLTELKKSVVFLGDINEDKKTREKKVSLHGTGFLVKIQDVYYLITAKHIVKDPATGAPKDSDTYVFLNAKKGNMNFRKIQDIKNKFKVDWVFHSNPDVDIAIIPWPLDLKNDDVRVVPEELFTKSDRIFELYDIFFISYQPGVEMTNKIMSVLKTGTVSMINDDKSFYINASAFPGNSGSPVFLRPSSMRFDDNNIAPGGDNLGGTFIGIVGNYITYQEMAVSVQTGRPRIVFEENTGLSKIWPVEFIQDILHSDIFRAQQMGLKKIFNIDGAKK